MREENKNLWLILFILSGQKLIGLESVFRCDERIKDSWHSYSLYKRELKYKEDSTARVYFVTRAMDGRVTSWSGRQLDYLHRSRET